MRIRTTLLGTALTMACYTGVDTKTPPGGLADDAGDDAGPGGTDDDGGPGRGEPADEPTCDVGRTDLQRLTREQYNNTIRELFGDDSAPADAFVPDGKTGLFANNATSGVSTLHVDDYATAAEAIAQRALAVPSELLPCDPASTGETECAEQFVAETGRRLFRRPVADEEAAGLMALFHHEAAQELSFLARIELVLTAMLQSPAFLYRLEYGRDDAVGDVVALSSYEMASRLSFFLWASTPDDELLDVADADRLGTSEEVALQAQRMLEDPRFESALASFHQQWLGVETLSAVPKNVDAFPEFTPELITAIEEESKRFVIEVIRDGDGRLETLLTSPTAWVDPQLAAFYGVDYPGQGASFEKVALDPNERAGLLTRASFAATHSGPTVTSPVLRGVAVRENVFCLPLPPPPDDADITPPEPEPGATTREVYEEHMKSELCGSCHRLINPVGFAFENYDALGHFRTTEAGRPVDASGRLVGTDADGAFGGPTAFVERVASSDQVRACVADQWMAFATGREAGEGDACSQASIFDRFQSSDYNIRELLVAIVTSDAFRYQPRQG